MAFSIDWEGTSTLVREKVIPRIKDQFFKKNVLMYMLRPKAEYFTGGTFIRQPLSFAPEGGGGQWWSGTDRFNMTIRNPFTSATFFSKNFELPVVVSQDDEDTVDGPEAFASLVESKMKIAQRTVMDSLGGANGVYNDGSNPKAMTGLRYSLADYTGTGAGTAPTKNYGGIPASATAYTWWNHQGYMGPSGVGNFITGSGSGGTYIQKANMGPWDDMLSLQGLAAGKFSTLILCNYGVWTEILQMIHAKTQWFRPQQDDTLVKAGFESFRYRMLNVVVDPFVPRGTAYGMTAKHEKVYFIDEESVHLWIHTKRDFSFTGFREGWDQAVRGGHIFFRGELTFDERRSSGVHPDVDCTATSP